MLGRPGCLWVEFRRLHYCLIKANVFPNRDNDRTSLKPISSAKESVNFPLEGLCFLRPSQSIYSILCHSGLSIRATTSAQTNSRIHHAKGPLTPDVAVLRRQPEPLQQIWSEGHAIVRQEDDFYAHRLRTWPETLLLLGIAAEAQNHFDHLSPGGIDAVGVAAPHN